jgi:hypothetical protein
VVKIVPELVIRNRITLVQNEGILIQTLPQ